MPKKEVVKKKRPSKRQDLPNETLFSSLSSFSYTLKMGCHHIAAAAQNYYLITLPNKQSVCLSFSEREVVLASLCVIIAPIILWPLTVRPKHQRQTRPDQTRPDRSISVAGSMFNSVDDSKVPELKLFFFLCKNTFFSLQKK